MQKGKQQSYAKNQDKTCIQNIPPEKQTKRRIMIWLKNIRNVSFIVFVFERVRKIQMGSFQADVIALWSRKRSEHV